MVGHRWAWRAAHWHNGAHVAPPGQNVPPTTPPRCHNAEFSHLMLRSSRWSSPLPRSIFWPILCAPEHFFAYFKCSAVWEAKIALYRLVVHRNRPPACFVPEQAPGSPRPTNLFRNRPPAYKPPACMHPLNAPEQPPAAAGFCLAMANQAEIFAACPWRPPWPRLQNSAGTMCAWQRQHRNGPAIC